MPFFKSTYNILKKSDEDEVFNENWMDSDTLILPPKKNWDYKKEMQIEDVNIWEVIYEQGGGLGLYAAWDPYAEFYMITGHHHKMIPNKLEFYYGKNASNNVYKRSKELGMPIFLNQIWVEKDDMWLYEH